MIIFHCVFSNVSISIREFMIGNTFISEVFSGSSKMGVIPTCFAPCKSDSGWSPIWRVLFAGIFSLLSAVLKIFGWGFSNPTSQDLTITFRNVWIFNFLVNSIIFCRLFVIIPIFKWCFFNCVNVGNTSSNNNNSLGVV